MINPIIDLAMACALAFTIFFFIFRFGKRVGRIEGELLERKRREEDEDRRK